MSDIHELAERLDSVFAELRDLNDKFAERPFTWRAQRKWRRLIRRVDALQAALCEAPR